MFLKFFLKLNLLC